MENEIVRLISRYLELTNEEASAFAECIPIKSFKKGDILLREGQVCRDSYFVIEGCVRKYYIIDGDERTTAFYVEDESIASLQSYTNKTPANHYFECVEDCRLAVLNYEKEQELFKRVPKYEALCRMSMEDDFGEQQEALAKFITSSPEERYKNLLETRPDLIQRVPQYHLASYLGVKPESLSRIRKRIAKK
ncbi:MULTISPECIES: Crp/Fnr family transcriptional regulator [Aequorivita]|jgi:CRP-like cAMP-binding protein|uniref:Crp/Fnr family transcriptional regulator n=1 Tax=Aequorivita iocasae TaxID=2803865 RepID=A0ABX7DR58_9FLAO|nr:MULTISPECIES: Crp/Fnr family transcriptional regulator [Aequorivita]QQX75274.1 Crp/Fnr family transcriptional regulator [Aequorivita iocasae]UCA54722.1 Crp/Fnr family transcriptional regulator [Aequorivita sp. F7]